MSIIERMTSIAAAVYDELLADVIESEQQIRYWQARQQHRLAELDRVQLDRLAPPGVNKHWAREDISCALRISPDLARMKMSVANDACEHFPELVKLLEAGQISLAHVLAFADAARLLDPADKRALLDLVVDQAPTQAITAFRRSVKQAFLKVRPVDSEANRRGLAEQRRMTVKHQAEGMSQLFADLPTEDAVALATAVEDLAQQWSRQPDETRTLDQLRVDAFVHLVCRGQGDQNAKVGVNVCVALSTLLGLDDEPAELTADGVPTCLGGAIVPIGAIQARLIAFEANSTWRRLITDERGVLLDYGRATYRPPAPLARFVRGRDRMCTFPHCSRPALRCEIDHRQDWELAGTTCECNLECLCARHHHLKHETDWTVAKLDDATTRWTSPTGHQYDRPPETYPLDYTAQATEDPCAPAAPPQDDPPPPF